MALPAIKGAIIVGGVAVAIGVALYEHEPFREWAHERWQDTSRAFEDLMDDLRPQSSRRAHQFGPSSPNSSNSNRRRRDFPWRSRRRSSPDARAPDGASASASAVARNGDQAGLLRNRKHNATADGVQLDEMSRQALAEEAILEHGGLESSRPSSETDRSSLQHLLPPRTSSRIPSTFDQILGTGQDAASEADPERPVLTPSTSSGALSEMASNEGSIQMIYTPTSTRPASEADPFDDARSNTTETMSHVSQDPVAGGGDVDDVQSMASSWSHVGDDDRARHLEEA